MSCVEEKTVVNVAIDGVVQTAQPDELLIDLINRIGGSVPHVCCHPQLGPVQTCDTCMVEANGRVARAYVSMPIRLLVIAPAERGPVAGRQLCRLDVYCILTWSGF
jgi:hypothetical protein